MKPNSTPPEIPPSALPEAPAAEPILQHQPDTGRFASANIRLSAALCSLGFHLRDDAVPVDITIPVSTSVEAAERAPTRVITFWHRSEPDPEAPIAHLKNEEGKQLVILPIDIKAWWDFPGRYSIKGFDDALNAIRRVLEHREWLLGLIHGSRRIENSRFNRSAVVVDSLHTASILKASGFALLAFQKLGPGARGCRFVFPAKSVGIVEQVEKYSSERRDDGRDVCADWMLSGLRFRDLLARRVREAGCIPMIELREGERILRISSQMPETLRKEWFAHW